MSLPRSTRFLIQPATNPASTGQQAINKRSASRNPIVSQPQAMSQSPIAPPETSSIVREDSSGAEVPEPLLSRAFIGEPRTIAFEYKENENVLCDGDFGLSNDYTKQTPFQEWTLQVKSSAPDRLNLTSVNSIRWEFLCEVCAV
ncbi:MAG: hypothetical protein HETSPECPRED_008570 [Heterodermia speciosa]|uniref:Uncharacterized protein n=1 Tax=Heterodermia speciosa TaxID=116794 RepID=A0A8H3IYQ1_9LECA|nr:MAG: hypothetical protein HETSPECPRED_008570 [Heterodermia speciosa]